MQTKRVILYYEDNPYETEEVYIEIKDNEISVFEVTSEKAPGDSYGLVHKLDRENTEKLLMTLESPCQIGSVAQSAQRSHSIGS